MSLARFPAHQKDHVFIHIPSPDKSDQKNQVVPNDFNRDITLAKRKTRRSDEYDGLLGKGMRQAS